VKTSSPAVTLWAADAGQNVVGTVAAALELAVEVAEAWIEWAVEWKIARFAEDSRAKVA